MIDKAPGTFDAADTEIQCDITALATAAGQSATLLVGGSLLNTCSYPSREPNSDPSDCVLTPTAVNTSMTTTAVGVATWSVTLSDSASIIPAGASGTVTFSLHRDDPSSSATQCDTLIWTKSGTLSGGVAPTGTTGGTPSLGNVVSTAGTYYWIASYGGDSLNNSSATPCGEAVTVTAPVVEVAP